MNKNTILLLGLIFSLLISTVSCKKNTTDSKKTIGKEWKLSANNKFEKPLSPQTSTISKTEKTVNKTESIAVAALYTCGSYLSDYFYGIGFYRYPPYDFDLSGTPLGSAIQVSVNSYDIPNRFTITDPTGNIVAVTGWMGYVNYPGPWGPSLNTPQTATLSFITDFSGTYTLTVETSTETISDSWDASISCTAPALTVVTTGNAGGFHNNTLTAIDNGFTISGVVPSTLLEADNYAKGYEKQYLHANNIDVADIIVDSSYGFRNKLFNINYSNPVNNLTSLNLRAIADSLMNQPNTALLMTNTEKTILQNLFTYLQQYQNSQIDYNTMKSNIASLKNTWRLQGFNVSLHQGDISSYTLNIADTSVTYWNSYGGVMPVRNSPIGIAILPVWVGLDAVGALGGALAAGLDSYWSSGRVNWRSVGAWALGGAIASSVPSLRVFRRFFR